MKTVLIIAMFVLSGCAGNRVFDRPTDMYAVKVVYPKPHGTIPKYSAKVDMDPNQWIKDANNSKGD